MAQGSEEPPFLRVGTEVSAKYRGAFCEASIKTVKKHVKCKIQYKDSTTATLTDDVVKGDLKVGSTVEVKTLDGRIMDGVIIKLTDASTYTVVFDDGDERTLRRTSLCLKGGRHFNESETLDHLPLTDPENFGTPVIQNGKKRKKRRHSTQQSSFEDGDSEKEDNSPFPIKKKCLYNDSIVGKIVVVERVAKRRSHWFPALGVSPSAENVEHIKSKDHCLVRSFKDGNYHVINIRDTKEFSKDQEPVSNALKSDSRTNKPGIERAIAYHETGRVPSTWEGSKSEIIKYDDTDDEAKKPVLRLSKTASCNDSSDSSDDDSERDVFMEKLQLFMEQQGTPITRNPVLGNQDLDLHKLYLLVTGAGGMEEVTRKQEWRNIYSKMGIAIMPPSASHHIKMAYKKYLYPYEVHSTNKDSDEERSTDVAKRDKAPSGRTRHERNSKSTRNIDKSDKTLDKRAKPVSSETAEKPAASKPPPLTNKPRRSSTPNSKPPAKQALNSPTTTTNKPTAKPSLPVSPPSKPNKLPLSSTFNTPTGKQAHTPTGKQVTTPTGKSKVLHPKHSSKSSTPDSSKDLLEDIRPQDIKIENESESENGAELKNVLKQEDEHMDQRRIYKHEDSMESDIDVDEEVTSPDSELAVDVVNSPGCMSDTSESKSDTRSDFGNDEPVDCTAGDKIQVKYGRGRNRRIYEAKIVTIDPDAEEGLLYLIHYTGWNIRYDEWISPDRILGKSNKVSKKKGACREYPKSKLPPKPLGKQYIRSQSKKGTKSPSPASPGSKPSENKVIHSNGSKAAQRASPPLPLVEPPSTKQGPKNGTSTRRTRSDRNSFSSNGLEEAVKSPTSRRRQTSLTPEPPEAGIPSVKPSDNTTVPTVEQAQEKSESDNENETPIIKKEIIKLENPDDDAEDTDVPESIKIEPKPNEFGNDKNSVHTKPRSWSKPNGLLTYSSSESGSPEHSASENDAEPASKKIKVEKEKELYQDEINGLLSTEVEGKVPIAVPHSEGSCSSDDQHVTTSPDQEDRQKNSAPGDTEQNTDSSENKDGSKSNSAESEGSKEEKSTNKEDTTSEKKENDHRGKRHRKKKERKRSRHHSVNENSNDGSPSNLANFPSSKGSPSRPKICFNADLESIKSMEDGSERIRLLQQKINEMRKLYGSLKAEVASIDRKRKKLKKKREEHAISSGPETKGTASSCVTNSPATVECR